MANPAIIQYWHAEVPPHPIVEQTASFRLCNPDLEHVLFNESTAADFVAEHLSSREASAFSACLHPTSQADYLRYCAGYVLGGLCIDADVRCSGSIRSLIEGPERGIVFGQRDPLPRHISGLPPWPYAVGAYETLINGIFAFAQAGDPLLRLAIDIATANIEQRIADGAKGIWLTTGPGVFTSLYLLLQLGSIDSFMRYTAGTMLDPSAALFCEVVGSASRVEQAFDGVDMAAVEDIDDRLRHEGVPRGDGDAHWSRPVASIFR